MDASFPTLKKPLHVCLLALGITAFHILFVLLMQTQSPYGLLINFLQSDTEWYRDILVNGYRHTVFPPANIILPPEAMSQVTNLGFFPGYPLSAKLIGFILPGSPLAILLMTSWIAAWGFWTYVLLLLKRWNIAFPLSALVISSIVAHPGAYYLVVAYSEPLFLAGLLGWLYWSFTDHKYLAALHGFFMNAVRVVGILITPLTIIDKNQRKHHLRIALLSFFGAVSFFLYCQIVFGDWSLYFQTQTSGWEKKADFLLIGNQYALDIIFPTITSLWNDVIPRQHASLLAMNAAMWLGLLVTFLAYKQNQLRNTMISILLLGGWFLLYVHAASVINEGFRSMLRYAFVSHVLFILAGSFLLKNIRGWDKVFLVAAVAILILAGTMQGNLIEVFTAGEWVA